MTGEVRNNAIELNAPKPLDARIGKSVAGRSVPFADKAEAFADTDDTRRSEIGLPVEIGPIGSAKVYRYQRAITWPTGGESGDGWNLVLDPIDARLTAVETANTAQDSRLTTIEGVNTSQDGQIASLTSRVTATEGVNTTQDSRLTAVETKNTQQDTAIGALQTSDTTQAGQISALNTRVTAVEGVNATQDTAIGSLGTRMTAVETANTTQDSRLTAIEAKNTQQDADIAGKAPTSHTHALSDLTQSGATLDQVPSWNGTNWIPKAVSSDPNAFIQNQDAVVQTAKFVISGEARASLYRFTNGSNQSITSDGLQIILEHGPLRGLSLRNGGAETAYFFRNFNGSDFALFALPNIFDIQSPGIDFQSVNKGTVNLYGLWQQIRINGFNANPAEDARWNLTHKIVLYHPGSGSPNTTAGVGIGSNTKQLHLSVPSNAADNGFLFFGGMTRVPFYIGADGQIICGPNAGNGSPLQVQNGILSTAASLADYPAINGGLFYRSDTHKIRACLNGAWQNLAIEANSSIGTAIVVDKNHPNSTDTRTGISRLSAAVPFKTIQAALTAAVFGDAIIIRAATYTENVIYAPNNGENWITFIGAVLNGSFIQTGDLGGGNGVWLNLINGATINGQVGQLVNANGHLRITGDKTGKIITGNLPIFSNLLTIRFLDILDTGTGNINSLGINELSDINTVIGYVSGTLLTKRVGSFTWTGTNAAIELQAENVGRLLNYYVPASGQEHRIFAQAVNFEFAAAPDMSALFQARFRNCTFLAPSGLVGFSNNANYYYLWEACSFEFSSAVTNAITLTPNVGTYAVVRNCTANSAVMINTHAQNLESNSYNNANFKILRGI